MKALDKLNQQEKEMLFKAPAYVSLLAANSDGEMDETELKSAIKFSHVKTYSCDPLLTDFYNEVSKHFDITIEQLDSQLPKDKAARKAAINNELLKLIPIFSKLGNVYADTLHRSFITYAEHVSKAHRNVLASFIIPFYIKGLTA
jgi:hypothetical protein